MKKTNLIRLICIIFTLCLFFSFTSYALTGSTFSSSGNHLIYVNNPESFGLNAGDLVYLYGTNLGNSYKDVEFYHHLYNAWSNAGACRVGVAIMNKGPKPAKITYKGSCTATLDGYNFAVIEDTSQVLKNFQKAKYQTVILNPGEKKIVWSDDFRFTPGFSEFVYGRAQFKSNQKFGVWLRVFAAGQSKTAEDVFKETLPVKGVGHGFCGELGYTEKNVTLDADSSNLTNLCEWPQSLNTYEYDGVINSKPGASKYHAGNYGVVYNITINHASNKKIIINPKWSQDRPYATLVYSVNNGPWMVGEKITTGMFWTEDLGYGQTANFKFMLPGGNCGSYYVSFE
ncbi:hypothetical protein [Clostridium sp. BNL1100]|uniref:hypothetical protein n=1 Tax=Clostridium sp. BNL1100 TaxID=755731 RepID=UPI00024A751B|nr:hypothetical protein [Clostridium sp. BNL1100]AEY66878.1 hypothetical protein Clo1100_2718 [Clostridium sp. BNL1100]